MAAAVQSNLTNLFLATVNDALKHYTDIKWLGQFSSLATPYFLGRHLLKVDNPGSVSGRGQALQQVVDRAADSLWPGNLPQSRQGLIRAVENERIEQGNVGPRYLYLLLDLRYLRRYFAPSTPPSQVSAMPAFLDVSETRFFAHLKTAREKLADSLIRLIRPSLQLEYPTLSSPVIGREDIIAQCLSSLHQNASVAISGMGGIGKTTLGTAIVHKWPSEAVCWYTFRPGLNDDLGSVVFTLGHFLNQWGFSNLWLQLMANEGNVGNIEQALGFLREDLNAAGQVPILLCFDEVDLLHTATDQPRHGVHKQILELLEGLRRMVPLLLIGQRALIDTHSHFALQPLHLTDTERFFERQGIEFPEATLKSIQELTEGNPRLLELYLTLYKTGGKEGPLHLEKLPSIKPLFNRLWKRLDRDEKHVLASLSVFRSFAPYDVWQDEGFQNLKMRNLLKFDSHGGTALIPLFRQLVFDGLPVELRQRAYQQAASVRAQLGRHTEAAYHLWQAGQYENAVNLWFQYQDIEIEQGKAGAAHTIFCAEDHVKLSGSSAKKLKIIQNRLNLLFGDAISVLANMDDYSWHPDERIAADAFQQWGDAYLIVGDTEKALNKFEDAISVLEDLSTQIVQLHGKRGQMLIERADINSATNEARLAQYEVERMKGLIAMAQGQYLLAQSHLETALQLAQSVTDERRVAKINYLLAVALGNYGNLELAHQYAELAMTHFKNIGDRLKLEGLRAELAGFYLNVGRFAEVISPAEKALRFFENIKHDLWIGYISSNLAEAYYETGDIELAEKYAFRAINSENPRIQPYAYYTLGLLNHARGNLDKSQASFQKGINFAKETGDQFIGAYLYRAYGNVLLQNNRLEEGLPLLKKALEQFSNIGIHHEVAKTQQFINAISE